MRYVLNMGEMGVVRLSGEIICYGLGSCVGVFLYDKFQKIGAGAHVMLPPNDGKPDKDDMIDAIIGEMLDMGCHSLTIRAKIVGGAKIMNFDSYSIGSKNILYTKSKLKISGIMLLSEDTGGEESRTACLNIASGILSVKKSIKNHYTI